MNEQVRSIPVSQLYPFQYHPFHVRDDEAMAALCGSIQEYGILSPLLYLLNVEGDIPDNSQSSFAVQESCSIYLPSCSQNFILTIPPAVIWYYVNYISYLSKKEVPHDI